MDEMDEMDEMTPVGHSRHNAIGERRPSTHQSNEHEDKRSERQDGGTARHGYNEVGKQPAPAVINHIRSRSDERPETSKHGENETGEKKSERRTDSKHATPRPSCRKTGREGREPTRPTGRQTRRDETSRRASRGHRSPRTTRRETPSPRSRTDEASRPKGHPTAEETARTGYIGTAPRQRAKQA